MFCCHSMKKNWESYSSSQIKDELRARRLSISGCKSELIKRLEDLDKGIEMMDTGQMSVTSEDDEVTSLPDLDGSDFSSDLEGDPLLSDSSEIGSIASSLSIDDGHFHSDVEKNIHGGTSVVRLKKQRSSVESNSSLHESDIQDCYEDNEDDFYDIFNLNKTGSQAQSSNMVNDHSELTIEEFESVMQSLDMEDGTNTDDQSLHNYNIGMSLPLTVQQEDLLSKKSANKDIETCDTWDSKCGENSKNHENEDTHSCGLKTDIKTEKEGNDDTWVHSKESKENKGENVTIKKEHSEEYVKKELSEDFVKNDHVEDYGETGEMLYNTSTSEVQIQTSSTTFIKRCKLLYSSKNSNKGNLLNKDAQTRNLQTQKKSIDPNVASHSSKQFDLAESPNADENVTKNTCNWSFVDNDNLAPTKINNDLYNIKESKNKQKPLDHKSDKTKDTSDGAAIGTSKHKNPKNDLIFEGKNSDDSGSKSCQSSVQLTEKLSLTNDAQKKWLISTKHKNVLDEVSDKSGESNFDKAVQMFSKSSETSFKNFHGNVPSKKLSSKPMKMTDIKTNSKTSSKVSLVDQNIVSKVVKTDIKDTKNSKMSLENRKSHVEKKKDIKSSINVDTSIQSIESDNNEQINVANSAKSQKHSKSNKSNKATRKDKRERTDKTSENPMKNNQNTIDTSKHIKHSKDDNLQEPKKSSEKSETKTLHKSGNSEENKLNVTRVESENCNNIHEAKKKKQIQNSDSLKNNQNTIDTSKHIKHSKDDNLHKPKKSSEKSETKTLHKSGNSEENKLNVTRVESENCNNIHEAKKKKQIQNSDSMKNNQNTIDTSKHIKHSKDDNLHKPKKSSEKSETKTLHKSGNSEENKLNVTRVESENCNNIHEAKQKKQIQSIDTEKQNKLKQSHGKRRLCETSSDHTCGTGNVSDISKNCKGEKKTSNDNNSQMKTRILDSTQNRLNKKYTKISITDDKLENLSKIVSVDNMDIEPLVQKKQASNNCNDKTKTSKRKNTIQPENNAKRRKSDCPDENVGNSISSKESLSSIPSKETLNITSKDITNLKKDVIKKKTKDKKSALLTSVSSDSGKNVTINDKSCKSSSALVANVNKEKHKRQSVKTDKSDKPKNDVKKSSGNRTDNLEKSSKKLSLRKEHSDELSKCNILINVSDCNNSALFAQNSDIATTSKKHTVEKSDCTKVALDGRKNDMFLKKVVEQESRSLKAIPCSIANKSCSSTVTAHAKKKSVSNTIRPDSQKSDGCSTTLKPGTKSHDVSSSSVRQEINSTTTARTEQNTEENCQNRTDTKKNHSPVFVENSNLKNDQSLLSTDESNSCNRVPSTEVSSASNSVVESECKTWTSKENSDVPLKSNSMKSNDQPVGGSEDNNSCKKSDEHNTSKDDVWHNTELNILGKARLLQHHLPPKWAETNGLTEDRLKNLFQSGLQKVYGLGPTWAKIQEYLSKKGDLLTLQQYYKLVVEEKRMVPHDHPARMWWMFAGWVLPVSQITGCLSGCLNDNKLSKSDCEDGQSIASTGAKEKPRKAKLYKNPKAWKFINRNRMKEKLLSSFGKAELLHWHLPMEKQKEISIKKITKLFQTSRLSSTLYIQFTWNKILEHKEKQNISLRNYYEKVIEHQQPVPKNHPAAIMWESLRKNSSQGNTTSNHDEVVQKERKLPLESIKKYSPQGNSTSNHDEVVQKERKLSCEDENNVVVTRINTNDHEKDLSTLLRTFKKPLVEDCLRELPPQKMYKQLSKSFASNKCNQSLYVGFLLENPLLCPAIIDWTNKARKYCINTWPEGKGAVLMQFVTRMDCEAAQKSLMEVLGKNVMIRNLTDQERCRVEELTPIPRSSHDSSSGNAEVRTLMVTVPYGTTENEVASMFMGCEIVGKVSFSEEGREEERNKSSSTFYVEYANAVAARRALAEYRNEDLQNVKLMKEFRFYYKNEYWSKFLKEDEKNLNENSEWRYKTKNYIPDKTRIDFCWKFQVKLQAIENFLCSHTAEKLFSYRAYLNNHYKKSARGLLDLIDRNTIRRCQLGLSFPEFENHMTPFTWRLHKYRQKTKSWHVPDDILFREETSNEKTNGMTSDFPEVKPLLNDWKPDPLLRLDVQGSPSVKLIPESVQSTFPDDLKPDPLYKLSVDRRPSVKLATESIQSRSEAQPVILEIVPTKICEDTSINKNVLQSVVHENDVTAPSCIKNSNGSHATMKNDNINDIPMETDVNVTNENIHEQCVQKEGALSDKDTLTSHPPVDVRQIQNTGNGQEQQETRANQDKSIFSSCSSQVINKSKDVTSKAKVSGNCNLVTAESAKTKSHFSHSSEVSEKEMVETLRQTDSSKKISSDRLQISKFENNDKVSENKISNSARNSEVGKASSEEIESCKMSLSLCLNANEREKALIQDNENMDNSNTISTKDDLQSASYEQHKSKSQHENKDINVNLDQKTIGTGTNIPQKQETGLNIICEKTDKYLSSPTRNNDKIISVKDSTTVSIEDIPKHSENKINETTYKDYHTTNVYENHNEENNQSLSKPTIPLSEQKATSKKNKSPKKRHLEEELRKLDSYENWMVNSRRIRVFIQVSNFTSSQDAKVYLKKYGRIDNCRMSDGNIRVHYSHTSEAKAALLDLWYSKYQPKLIYETVKVKKEERKEIIDSTTKDIQDTQDVAKGVFQLDEETIRTLKAKRERIKQLNAKKKSLIAKEKQKEKRKKEIKAKLDKIDQKLKAANMLKEIKVQKKTCHGVNEDNIPEVEVQTKEEEIDMSSSDEQQKTIFHPEMIKVKLPKDCQSARSIEIQQMKSPKHRKKYKHHKHSKDLDFVSPEKNKIHKDNKIEEPIDISKIELPKGPDFSAKRSKSPKACSSKQSYAFHRSTSKSWSRSPQRESTTPMMKGLSYEQRKAYYERLQAVSRSVERYRMKQSPTRWRSSSRERSEDRYHRRYRSPRSPRSRSPKRRRLSPYYSPPRRSSYRYRHSPSPYRFSRSRERSLSLESISSDSGDAFVKRKRCVKTSTSKSSVRHNEQDIWDLVHNPRHSRPSALDGFMETVGIKVRNSDNITGSNTHQSCQQNNVMTNSVYTAQQQSYPNLYGPPVQQPQQNVFSPENVPNYPPPQYNYSQVQPPQQWQTLQWPQQTHPSQNVYNPYYVYKSDINIHNFEPNPR